MSKPLFTKPAVGRLSPTRKRPPVSPDGFGRDLRDATRAALRERQWRAVLSEPRSRA